MEDGNGNTAGKDGSPGRPHWRHRDPSATAVYVVHPTQFRTVVQHLTGAPPGTSPPPPANAAKEKENTAKQQGRPAGGGGGGGSSRRTLGQMHQECMAWAQDDD